MALRHRTSPRPALVRVLGLVSKYDGEHCAKVCAETVAEAFRGIWGIVGDDSVALNTSLAQEALREHAGYTSTVLTRSARICVRLSADQLEGDEEPGLYRAVFVKEEGAKAVVCWNDLSFAF